MSTETNNRGARKVRKGVVVSKMGTKSVVVEVSYREIHPVYGKVITRTKKYHAHDEADTAKVGDTVSIMETRPMSATFLRCSRSPRTPAARRAFSCAARSMRFSISSSVNEARRIIERPLRLSIQFSIFTSPFSGKSVL